RRRHPPPASCRGFRRPRDTRAPVAERRGARGRRAAPGSLPSARPRTLRDRGSRAADRARSSRARVSASHPWNPQNASDIFRAVRGETRAFSALDLVVTIAVLALLVWMLRLDWRRERALPGAGDHSATRSSWTSV